MIILYTDREGGEWIPFNTVHSEPVEVMDGIRKLGRLWQADDSPIPPLNIHSNGRYHGQVPQPVRPCPTAERKPHFCVQDGFCFLFPPDDGLPICHSILLP